MKVEDYVAPLTKLWGETRGSRTRTGPRRGVQPSVRRLAHRQTMGSVLIKSFKKHGVMNCARLDSGFDTEDSDWRDSGDHMYRVVMAMTDEIFTGEGLPPWSERWPEWGRVSVESLTKIMFG
jgi:hypothetical protein